MMLRPTLRPCLGIGLHSFCLWLTSTPHCTLGGAPASCMMGRPSVILASSTHSGCASLPCSSHQFCLKSISASCSISLYLPLQVLFRASPWYNVIGLLAFDQGELSRGTRLFAGNNCQA